MSVKPTNRREDVLPDLLRLCEKLDRIPLVKEIIQEGIVGCSKTLKLICQENGYSEYKDFCRQHDYGCKTDVYVNSEYRCHSNLTLNDLVILWNEFKEKHNKFPTKEDLAYKKKYGHNLPTYNRFMETLNKNELTFNNFKDLIGDDNHQVLVGDYDKYVEKYKAISIKKGHYLTYKNLLNNTYGLPESRWFVKHCPDKNVKNFNNFVEWCGFIPTSEVSKELVTKLILKKSKDLNRPLVTEDFANPNKNEIGSGTIKYIWGTFNNMKIGLGLEISQESTFKGITFEKIKRDLINVCDIIYKKDKRTVINTFDINKHGEYSYSTYYQYFKDNNQLICDYLKSIGFSFQKCGCGISTTFNDGEVTLSQFETKFSKYLKDVLNLRYNVDYFRDVRYSEFVSRYEGLMNCDYMICIENQIIYIEIAGILRDYKDWYDGNIEISSSISKEKYRQTLKKKENMFKNNNLEYRIIFPQDCNEEFFNTLFKWEDVDKCGEINSL